MLDLALHERRYVSGQFCNGNPLLRHGIAVANGDGVILFNGLKIHRNAQWCADFVVTSVTFTNIAGVLIKDSA